MVRFLKAQRHAAIFFAALIFTVVIRLVSMSFGHIGRHRGGNVVLSDRGRYKQVAFRITHLHERKALELPFRLGVYKTQPSTSYLLRIANFSPFITFENLDLYKDMSAFAHLSSPRSTAFGMMTTSCSTSNPTGLGFGDGGGGGGGDGDGGDGDGDGAC